MGKRSAEEEYGIESADISIDECDFRLEDLEDDQWKWDLRENLSLAFPMSGEDTFEEICNAFRDRVEERLKRCECGQPPMMDHDQCADCRTVAEGF